MATYRILCWQELPSQIVATGDDGEVSLPMPQKFLERIDEVALERGLATGDEYLAQWHWSEEADRDGTAAEVAAAVLAELVAQADW